MDADSIKLTATALANQYSQAAIADPRNGEKLALAVASAELRDAAVHPDMNPDVLSEIWRIFADYADMVRGTEASAAPGSIEELMAKTGAPHIRRKTLEEMALTAKQHIGLPALTGRLSG